MNRSILFSGLALLISQAAMGQQEGLRPRRAERRSYSRPAARVWPTAHRSSPVSSSTVSPSRVSYSPSRGLAGSSRRRVAAPTDQAPPLGQAAAQNGARVLSAGTGTRVGPARSDRTFEVDGG